MNEDRFKFRVRDKVHKKYLEEMNLADTGGIFRINAFELCDSFSFDEVIVEQCLGKKDKNGKLIYEHDVVLYKGKPVYVVYGRGCSFYLTSVYTTKYGGVKLLSAPGVVAITERFPVCPGVEKQLEVIGNIHEERFGMEDRKELGR